MDPPSKRSPPPFLNEVFFFFFFFAIVVEKGAFLSKIHLFMPQYVTLSTEEAALCKRTTNENRQHLLLLHKQAQHKRGIPESLHANIYRARLTACGGCIIERISQLLKIHPPPSLRSHGHFLRDYGMN